MKRLLLIGLLALALPAAAAGAGDVQLGHHLFGQYCVSCHGVGGSGIQPARQGQLAPSLRGVGALAADFYLRTGYMPLQHVGIQPHRQRVFFDETQLQGLIAYVASLGPGPNVPRPHPERGNLSEGQSLFAEHCAGCHQIAAQGGYVTGAVAWPLEKATPTQIAEAVRIGPYVMPTFSRRQLSDRQLDSIIAYVRYATDPPDYGGWGIGHIGPVPEGLIAWFFGGTVLVGTCIVIGRRLRRGGD
jgi:ubiquinol-cytochrome c reductase cytochrome c subunit